MHERLSGRGSSVAINETSEARAAIVEFVTANYLFGDATGLPPDEDSLVETGVIDSTGILEMIEFLESHFGIYVLESETVPDNLGSIAGLTKYVEAKTALDRR